MRSSVAHIINAGSHPFGWWLAAAVLVVALLIVENRIVAGPATPRNPSGRRGVAMLVVVALSAVLVPASQAQSASGPLPDLISDPPRPSFFNEITDPDGRTRLVLTFDGYVHNIGEGALDVVGNPQQPGGMKQRVRTSDGWEDVGTPTIRFETDDGHNHFHLIEAIEYVLWNELQGAQTAIGSKIGFCLVDSEQMEPGTEATYSEETDNFCQENNPTATELRMGISAGWRDIYDDTTTLQWVDVSTVAPGRYWIGAITDPNNEIVESNEDNNGLVFSRRAVSIPGYEPRQQPPVAISTDPTEIELATTVHGDVGQPIFVIESGPSSGTLNVPIGADLDISTVVYTPEPGFQGDDEFVFSVRNAGSPYPYEPPTQTVDLTIDAAAGATSAVNTGGDDSIIQGAAPSLVAPSTFFDTTAGTPFEVRVESFLDDGSAGRVFASGLPTGLTIDSSTGLISGSAITDGIFEAELIAVNPDGSATTSQAVTFIVAAADAAQGLAPIGDRSSPRSTRLRIRIGTNQLGSMFSASGMPPGVAVDSTSPVLVGRPTDVGAFEVTFRETSIDDVVTESSFTWVIRPSTDIAFVL